MEQRPYTVFRSAIVSVIPQVDMDKKLFLEEYLKLLGYADMYFKQREFVAFYNTGLVLAYCSVVTQTHFLAHKVYSLFGQMLIAAKNFEIALELYKKLRVSAHTQKDIILKAYALR